MASLTPNEDAVRAAFKLPDYVEAALGAPGPEGVRARVATRMLQAYGLAFAAEEDLGTNPVDIVDAFSLALGNVGAGLMMSLSSESRALLKTFLLMVELRAFASIDHMEEGVEGVISVPRAQSGRA